MFSKPFLVSDVSFKNNYALKLAKKRLPAIYCPLGLLCRGHSNFPVRPSVRLSVCLSVCPSVRHTQFWTSSERNCTAHETIRGQNRVRLGHFAKAHLYEDNPNVPLAHSRLSAE